MSQVIEMPSQTKPNPVYDGNTVVAGAYKVDVHQGTMNGVVSSQWFNRPDDQRFLDLNSLYAHVRRSADTSRAEVFESKDIQVRASQNDPDMLSLLLPDGEVAEPTHWSFGQAASLVGAPAGYLRKLPASIAGINLQYGLSTHRAEMIKSYTTTDGRHVLRALTGPDYGRIHDWEVVQSVQRIAGNGTGDTHWKIPGVLNWGDGTYNPDAPITKQSTTLFASDRDVFLFLVDDRRPIEIGKLPNGDPDLVFRGFYVQNSEVGSQALKLAAFYLRGVCQNRMLWGVEGFQQCSIRHSKNAPDRFIQQAAPALEDFSRGHDAAVIAGVQTAKRKIVAKDDEDRVDFLTNRGFSKSAAKTVINTVLEEEGHEPESVWDFVQGITAVARDVGHQDARLAMERTAGRMLDRVK